jgi:two-component system, NarL family, nitrate/nitrite response regulator NarL
MDLGAPATVPLHSEELHTTRVVLVDGQRLFRQALCALLAEEGAYTVVGETGQAAEALHLVARLEPAVVITELHISGASGVQLIEQIHARFHKVAILVLTAVRAHDATAAVRRAGALGYLLKDCGSTELRSALRAVVAGQSYRSRTPSSRARVRAEFRCAANGVAYLTERQRVVLRLVARGQPARQIAQMLGVSVRAVHRQRERLRTTLQLDSTAALARFALREGFAE